MATEKTSMEELPMNQNVWLRLATSSEHCGGSPTTDTNGMESTPLIEAAKYNFCQALHILLERGARDTPAGPHSNTALHFAAKCGCLTCVRDLVEYGSNLRQKDSRGRTALVIAAYYGHLKVVQFLVNRISNDLEEIMIEEVNMAITVAAVNEHISIVEFLLKDINFTNYGSRELGLVFMKALRSSSWKNIEGIIKNIDDANSSEDKLVGYRLKSPEGLRPAILIAVANRDEEMVKLLLLHGLGYDCRHANPGLLFQLAATVGVSDHWKTLAARIEPCQEDGE